MHKFSKVDTGAAAILKVWRMAEVTADWDLNIKRQPQAALGGHHGASPVSNFWLVESTDKQPCRV